MSSSANLCVRYIIGSHGDGGSGYPKMLHLLVDSTQTKGNRDSTRVAGQDYLRLALSAWPKKACAKEATSIRNAIINSLKDPNVDVRAFARLTYWSFHVHWEEEATSMLRQLSTAETQRLFNAKPTSELKIENNNSNRMTTHSLKSGQRLKFDSVSMSTST